MYFKVDFIFSGAGTNLELLRKPQSLERGPTVMSKHPSESCETWRALRKRLMTRGEEKSPAPGEKLDSISENIRWTSSWQDLNLAEEQKTFISHKVSKTKIVEVCHFSLT